MLTKKVHGWLGSPGAPTPQVSLAAFGKHPGWNDHIEDLGLDTEALVQARRVLYSEGLGGNIESGAWDKLEEAQRLPGFGHIVLWRRGWDLLLARLWSSSDGKGRSRYPMILCAHCSAIPMSWAVAEILPRLEKAHERCAAATTADEVREIVQATRLKLKTALSGSLNEIGSWHGDDVVSDRELARLAESPRLRAPAPGPGPAPAPSPVPDPHGTPPSDHTGLLRILYQVDREMGAFIAGSGKDRKSALLSARPQQIRVPSCGVAAGDAGRLWTGVLLETLADTAPIMTVQAFDQRWLDVIVGEPASANLFCIRASEKMIPLTSDVPYTLEPDFIARAEAMIGAWSGKVPPPPPPKPASGVRAAPPADALSDPLAAGAVPDAPSRLILWIVLITIGVILIAVLVMFISRGPSRSAAVPATPTPAPLVITDAAPTSPPAPAPPAPIPPAATPQDRPAASPTSTAPSASVTPEPAPAAAASLLGSAPATPPQPSPKPAEPPAASSQAIATPIQPPPTPAPPVPQPTTKPAPISVTPTPPSPPTTTTITIAVIAEAVREGLALSDPIAPNSPPLAQAAATLNPQSPDAEPVLARIQKLKDFAASPDKPALQQTLSAAKPDTAFEGFAAWRRLVELGWPASADDLGNLPSLLDRVLALADTVDDGARRPALRAEFKSSAKAAALRGIESARTAEPPSDELFTAILIAAKSTGLARQDLPPPLAINLLIFDLRTTLRTSSSGTAAARDTTATDAINSFITAAKDIRLDPPARDDLAGLSARLSKLLDPRDQTPATAPASTGPDLAVLGPGSAGWKARLSRDGDSIAYAPTAPASPPSSDTPRPDEIEFLRLSGDGSTAVYLTRDEVSIGSFIRIIASRGRWQDLRDRRLLRGFDPSVNDPRAGPTTWTWSAKRPGEIELAAQWLPSLSLASAYGSNPQPAPPTLDAPMQQASIDAMVYAARLIGCRLPTTAEWRRAVSAQPLQSFSAPNRRDASWVRQRDWADSIKTRISAPPWPDRGAYKPKDMQVLPLDDRAKPVTTDDDGSLWFARVNAEAQTKTPAPSQPSFRHLIGNVAEVICDDPARLEGIDPAKPESIDAALGDRSSFRILGASALSAPDLDPNTPYPVERTPSREGWADVGFRLAFTTTGAGGGGGGVARADPLWSRAQALLPDIRYLD